MSNGTKAFIATTIGGLSCLGVIAAFSAFVAAVTGGANVTWSWYFKEYRFLILFCVPFILYGFLMYGVVWYLREKKKITQEKLNYYIIPPFIVVIGLLLLSVIFSFIFSQNKTIQNLFCFLGALFIILASLCVTNNYFFESSNTQQEDKQ